MRMVAAGAVGLLLGALVAASPSSADHGWRAPYTNLIMHRPDTGGVTEFVWGDWLGNESYRAAFRSRVTDNAVSSLEWASSVTSRTTTSGSGFCAYDPVPLRPGIYDACVGDYAAYFTAGNQPSNTIGLAEANYEFRDGTAHIVTGRFLVDSGRTGTEFLRLLVICQEAGHLMGLAHNSDASCMNSTSGVDTPNAHDHQQLDAIYAHDDSYQY